jgi:hypothetical protein
MPPKITYCKTFKHDDRWVTLPIDSNSPSVSYWGLGSYSAESSTSSASDNIDSTVYYYEEEKIKEEPKITEIRTEPYSRWELMDI